jgi:Family of unknown function (DUF6886)
MPLYHFSEEPDIRGFEPRRSRLADEALVWAIDEWHAPMYYFPRDCPRACFWPGPQTTADDRERWFGGVKAKMVIAVESTWLDRIRTAQLYRYTLPEGDFALHDATAGHWVSRGSITPLAAEPVGDLARADVELRITPALTGLWSLVIASTLEFSGTRLGNAHGWLASASGGQVRSA